MSRNSYKPASSKKGLEWIDWKFLKGLIKAVIMKGKLWKGICLMKNFSSLKLILLKHTVTVFLESGPLRG